MPTIVINFQFRWWPISLRWTVTAKNKNAFSCAEKTWNITLAINVKFLGLLVYFHFRHLQDFRWIRIFTVDAQCALKRIGVVSIETRPNKSESYAFVPTPIFSALMQLFKTINSIRLITVHEMIATPDSNTRIQTQCRSI